MEWNNLTISTLLDFGSLLIGSFAMALLLQKNKHHYRWAIVCLLAFILYSLPPFIKSVGYDLPRFFGNPSFQLLFPIAFYFYVRQILGKASFSTSKLLLLLLPFIIPYIVFLFMRAPLPPIAGEGPPPFFEQVKGVSLLFIINLTYGGYLWAIYRLLRQHSVAFRNYYAQRDIHTNLNWVKYTIGIIIIGIVVGSVIRHPFFIGQVRSILWVLPLLKIIMLIAFSYFLNTQTVLYETTDWLNAPTMDEEHPTIPEVVQKPQNLLPAEVALIKQLEAYIQHNHPYLQPKLKIADLATALDAKPHQLSRLINLHYDTNFFHFINRYRIEYAMQLLQQPEARQLTLEAVGQQAGFQTRSTFNARFKAHTGMTPGAYLKKHNTI